MQYPTCCHIKEDGTYCGSPALRDCKYCHYHLISRGRRLRRARALRDNVAYRLDLPPLEDLAAVQVALSEITLALGAGQLDHRAAGKMLYAIQQTTSVIKFRAKLEAAQSQTAQQSAENVSLTSVSYQGAASQVAEKLSPASGSYQGAASAAPPAVESSLGFSPCDSAAPPTPSPVRVQAYPGFEQEFGINPGADVDAAIDLALRQADEEAERLHAEAPPAPPPGMRLGSAQYRIYREEVYQGLNIRLNRLKHELREYHEQKRKESEKLVNEARKEAGLAPLPFLEKEEKKAAASAAPVPEPLTTSA